MRSLRFVSTPLRVTKGHGTENDFVLLPDPDGEVDLTPGLVRALCDRRAGVGGDGLIRVVRSSALPDGAHALAADPGAEWFMDYHNGDGSTAEMCGNGVRVFAAYLLREGLVPTDAVDGGAVLSVGSRGGVKRVTYRDGLFAVDMGGWAMPGGAAAAERGYDARVSIHGLDGVPRPAISLDLGNPHTVVALQGRDELDDADLARAPLVDPVPPHGTNVELVVPGEPVEDGGELVGRLAMRVHERGSGETRSCGTGACAAVLAARLWSGGGSPQRWLVDVLGGRVEVRVLEDGDAGDGHVSGGDVSGGGAPGRGVPGSAARAGRVELAGPATLVADAVLDPAWVAAVLTSDVRTP